MKRKQSTLNGHYSREKKMKKSQMGWKPVLLLWWLLGGGRHCRSYCPRRIPFPEKSPKFFMRSKNYSRELCFIYSRPSSLNLFFCPEDFDRVELVSEHCWLIRHLQSWKSRKKFFYLSGNLGTKLTLTTLSRKILSLLLLRRSDAFLIWFEYFRWQSFSAGGR